MLGSGRRTIRATGQIGLAVAATIVGVAIAIEGPAARAINAIGGVVWLVSLGLLVWSVRREPRGAPCWASVLGTAVVLAVAVKPSDALMALIGFTIAGLVVAQVARRQLTTWALLVPAVWLPIHLLLAIGHAVARAAVDVEPTVRTDPPPTAALVPLVMVAAAWLGARTVEELASRWSAGMERGEPEGRGV